MKTKLTRTERKILGLCEVFYHKHYTQLKHNAVHWMLYLLYRKNVSVGQYSYIESSDGPYSADLEADLNILDEKQEDIMDFYDAELTIHAVPAAYLGSADCIREMLDLKHHDNVVAWVDMLAYLSFMAASETGGGTRIIICNRYMMLKPNADYEPVKEAWQVLDSAGMTFVK